MFIIIQKFTSDIYDIITTQKKTEIIFQSERKPYYVVNKKK